MEDSFSPALEQDRGGARATCWRDGGGIHLASVYLSPRLSMAETEDRLDELAAALNALGSVPTIVAGDFNAHAMLWGSRTTNARGRLVMDWAISNNLRCINRGRESTCVRTQGESIVDITWASPGCAQAIVKWEVLRDAESMSDHMYIEFSMNATGNEWLTVHRPPLRRWSTRKLDADKMVASLLISSWPRRAEEEEEPLERRVWRLRDTLFRACDISMPRTVPRPRRAKYWWSQEIEDLRRSATRARRSWTTSRRRRRDPEEIDAKRALYKEAKKMLGIAISRAKARSWGELLSSLDDDPWGLAYKIVRKKLRGWTLPVTEQLDPGFLGEVADTLFPDSTKRDQNVIGSDEEAPPSTDRPPWEEEWRVTEGEATWAIKRMSERNAAPGPDGLHSKALSLAYRVIGNEMRETLTDCLKKGHFPTRWKEANLVLLHKEGKREALPSSYRPICSWTNWERCWKE